MKNFDCVKFSPHRIADLLAQNKSRDGFGDTAITYMLERAEFYITSRKKQINSKFLSKGIIVESDSITLLNSTEKYKDFFLVENDKSKENDFMVGTADIVLDDRIIDIKSSYSWDTFEKCRYEYLANKKFNKDYFAQLQSYMWLYEKENASLVYCLSNTPFHLIESQKWRIINKYGVIDEDAATEKYNEEIDLLIKNSIFDDKQLKDRVLEIEINRDNEFIEKIKNAVILAREWMNANLMYRLR